MIPVWIEHHLLSKVQCQNIQQFIDNLTVPSDIGQIPLKMKSGFTGYKAVQVKTWIAMFSIPTLFHILPTEHLECWRHFVLAILCKQSCLTMK